MLLILLFVVGVAYGEVEESSSSIYNKSSDYFYAHDDHSIVAGESWTADIEPHEGKYVFIVIEQMILHQNDNISIISNNETLENINGSHGPFSLFVNNTTVTIRVVASSDKDIERKFKGYYTDAGCVYQMNETLQVLSTPQVYKKDDALKCNFSFPKQSKMFSKLSITFLEFQFNKDEFNVIFNGNKSYSFTGTDMPPEIITNKELMFSFTVKGNDTAKFSPENVLRDSQNIELSATKVSQPLIYGPEAIKGYYPSGEECHWVIKSEKDTTISFKFMEMNLTSRATHITINDGKNKYAPLLFQASSDKMSAKNRYISSSGNYLWISIEQPDESTLVVGNATMHQKGGYKIGSGELAVPVNSTEVVYLLEEENGENIILENHKGNLTANSTILIYDDFSTDSTPIMVLNTSLPNYPIVSSTSRMMVIAENFTGVANYQASFKKVNNDCYKMSTLENGEYSLINNCNSTCKWIVPPAVGDSNSVISLHLHPAMFEQQDFATLCLLNAPHTVITNITSQMTMLPDFYLPSSTGFLLNSVRGNCSSGNMLHGSFEKRKGCNAQHKLKPGSQLSVSSPNFPNTYPLLAHCWTNITTMDSTKNGRFLLTFNKIDLAATHCLRVRGIVGNSSTTMQKYEGSLAVLPGDLILNNSASIEFSAQPCNSTKIQLMPLSTASGFSLNITAADCGDKITKTEGNFSTPGFPKNTNASVCIWILEVSEKNAKSLNIINFTLTKNDSKDFELDIYDGGSIHNGTLKNHSSSPLLSQTNSLIFVYRRRNNTSTAPGILVAFHAQECKDKCQNGRCLHKDWKCNGINECGDNTDEIDCEVAPFITTTTPSPPEEKSYGVSPVAVGLGIPIAFVLGCLAAIYLPPLIRRVRSGQYHQFRDISADA